MIAQYSKLRDIVKRFPSPLKGIVYDDLGEYLASIIFMEEYIHIKWTDKENNITYNSGKLTYVDFDNVTGTIDFKSDDKQMSVVIFIPLMNNIVLSNLEQ